MAVAKMSVPDLEEFLHEVFPQAFRIGGDIGIEQADGRICRVRQRYSDRMMRPGGARR